MQQVAPLQDLCNQSHEPWFLVSFPLLFSLADILGAVPTMRARDRTVVTGRRCWDWFLLECDNLLLVGVGPRTNLSRGPELSSARHQVKEIFGEIQKVELASHTTIVSPRRGAGIWLL